MRNRGRRGCNCVPSEDAAEAGHGQGRREGFPDRRCFLRFPSCCFRRFRARPETLHQAGMRQFTFQLQRKLTWFTVNDLPVRSLPGSSSRVQSVAEESKRTQPAQWSSLAMHARVPGGFPIPGAVWNNDGSELGPHASMTATTHSLQLALLSAAVLGFRHGFDYDHIAAISDITSVQTSRGRGMRLGLLYALGHAAMVAVLGSLVILLQLSLPRGMDRIAERLVGLTLL